MAGTLIKTEVVFNTRENTKTTTLTYESFNGFGSEIDGLANRKLSQENGIFRYSGEIVEYFEGTGEESAGGEEGGGGGGDIYSIEISTGSEPIETHPLFQELSQDFWRNWEIWKNDKTSQLLTEDNLPSGSQLYLDKGFWSPFKITSAPASILVQKYTSGIREYLSPKVISRHQTSGPPINLFKVGKIDTPPYTAGLSSTWLFTGASSRYNVMWGTFETTYEWLASGPKDWDEQIYG